MKGILCSIGVVVGIWLITPILMAVFRFMVVSGLFASLMAWVGMKLRSRVLVLKRVIDTTDHIEYYTDPQHVFDELCRCIGINDASTLASGYTENQSYILTQYSTLILLLREEDFVLSSDVCDGFLFLLRQLKRHYISKKSQNIDILIDALVSMHPKVAD